MCRSLLRRTLPGLAVLLALTLLSPPAQAGRHGRSARDDHRSKQRSHRVSDGHADAHATSGWGHRPGGRHRGHHWRPWHGWGHWMRWRHQWLCGYLAHEVEEAESDRRLAHLQLFADLFGCETPEPEPPEPEPTAAPPPDATILDAAGAPVADVGSLELDDGPFRVSHASSFSDPVVILGPPTDRDSDPGVARLEGVDGEGFRVRFAEWSYLDGVHEAENVSYLVLEPGRHRLADGSEWEVGSLDLAEAGVWESLSFAMPFKAQPSVFLTVQTGDDGEPVVVRARDVTPDGFQAALFEEEGADGVHASQRVGYLAVVSPEGSGRVDTTTGSLPYLVREVAVDDRPVPVLSASLRLEEEASADDERVHAEETLSFMAIGPKVFAQDLSSVDLDTAAVRRSAPEAGPVLEWGTLPDVDDGWHTVPLALEYTNPVVVVGPMSSNDVDPGVLRVRNVTTDAFELRVQDWSYLDPAHAPERAFYLVADPGIQSLAGLMVEAGHSDVDIVVDQGMQDVPFALAFPEAPGVFASVMTVNDPEPVMVRVTDRTETGFRMAMQEQEGNVRTFGHMPETLGWLAIQIGSGTTDDGRHVGVFDAAVDHVALPVPFGATMRGRFPSVLAQIVTGAGLDPAEIRLVDLVPDAVTLKVEEEQSFDDETNHRVEDVSVFVAE